MANLGKVTTATIIKERVVNENSKTKKVERVREMPARTAVIALDFEDQITPAQVDAQPDI